ncbi:ATP-binding protein [Streptomyces tendae]|nr:ATP-binding protein [Streptomyces sp. SID5914]MZG15023.1 hypothetical protein [Streptomyces sp. SID5914]
MTEPVPLSPPAPPLREDLLDYTPTQRSIPLARRRAARLVSEDDERFGRGLLLVGALATRWGWELRSVGKTVYAEWDLPTPAVVVT